MLDYFFAHQRYENTPISELGAKRIAIPSDFVTADFIRQQFPEFLIVEFDTLYEAIDAVV